MATSRSGTQEWRIASAPAGVEARSGSSGWYILPSEGGGGVFAPSRAINSNSIGHVKPVIY